MARDQTQPGSFSREREEPGNEVASHAVFSRKYVSVGGREESCSVFS